MLSSDCPSRYHRSPETLQTVRRFISRVQDGDAGEQHRQGTTDAGRKERSLVCSVLFHNELPSLSSRTHKAVCRCVLAVESADHKQREGKRSLFHVCGRFRGILRLTRGCGCRRHLLAVPDQAAQADEHTPSGIHLGRSKRHPKRSSLAQPKEFAEPVKRALDSNWQIVTVEREADVDVLKQLARESTALVGGLAMANTLLRSSDPARLKLLQCHFAERIGSINRPSPRACVCSCAGAMDAPIAEWVIGVILGGHLDVEDAAMRKRCADALAAGNDGNFATLLCSAASAVPHGAVGIGGWNNRLWPHWLSYRPPCRRVWVPLVATVGRERPPREAPSSLSWLGGRGDLPTLLKESDFVVMACPLNDTTRGLMNKETLALLKPSAYLINIARGQVVDEDALFEALKSGNLGGAAIDVWWKLPGIASGGLSTSCAPYDLAKHPFHELPNVLLSPHTSGWSSAQLERRIKTVAANLDAIYRGEAPANVVATG